MKKVVFLLSFLLWGTSINAQETNDQYAKDVSSVDAIISAYYDVFSGASTDPWQFKRDKFLHSKNAIITSFTKNGTAIQQSLEAVYVPLLSNPREDFFEVELHRITEQYGNMAHVWSTFEVRSKPNEPSKVRGLNSVSLYYSEGRWYIGNWTTQNETDKPIPNKYLPNRP